MVTKPILQALVLADHVYEDRRTGKMVIAGTFGKLWAAEFPARLGRTTQAYICLTDLQGPLSLSLRYRDLKTNELLLRSPDIEVQCENPLATVQIVAEVPPFPMPHEGFYAFDLHAGDELLGSLRIEVGKREVKSDGQPRG